MSKQNNTSHALIWRLLAILVILFYLIGIVLMILGRRGVGNFGNGVTLWALSTVIGAIALYVKRTNDNKAADQKEFEENERLYQQKLREEAQNQEQK